MKKTIIILSALCIAAVAVSCNNTTSNPAAEASEGGAKVEGGIVFINLDTVINEYDMANDLRSVAETKINGINQEVNRRGEKLQKDVDSFQEKINKGLLTRSVAEVQSQKLQEQQNEFQNYAAQKQQEINEEQVVMMNQIADAIKTFLDAYREEMGYSMILTTQGEILPTPIASASEELDITEDVLTRLNEEYVKEKSKESK